VKAEINEQILLRGLVDNDSKAIETIYKENYNMVQAFILNNNGTYDDARDVFQEAMITLYEKAKSESNRLRGVVENERIERDRNLAALAETVHKLESQLKNSELRSPMDGLLTDIKTIDNELVGEGNELFTVSSRKNYVRGEVNEEDVGSVKPGMKAVVRLYAYRNQQLAAKVSSIQPAADPETQRYTIVLQLDSPPDNLMAGMTGEMNIITGMHDNALLVPTRALHVDQVLVVKNGIVQKRTVTTGYQTLDFTEILKGLTEGNRVIVADQDRMRPGRPVRQHKVDIAPPPRPK